MRNVRISDPLDGSGGGFGKKVPASEVQRAGNKVQSPQTPVKQNQIVPPSNLQPVQATTKRAPLLFTTQSTIKPACAGCGYVTFASTTRKPITHSLVNKPQQLTTSAPFIPSSGFTQSNNYQPGIFAQNGNRQNAIVPQVQPISQDNLVVHVNGQTDNQIAPQQAGQSFPNSFPPFSSGVGPSQSIQASQPPTGPSVSQTLPGQPSPFVQPPAFSAQQPQISQQNIDSYNPFNGQSNIAVPAVPEHNRADDIKVENGMILVPNNPPIPIKDKYPGMVDGLPKGIEEKDIKDLLYKFNYTIGFHGHYERGYKDGSKIGGYFVNGRDGISRVVTYVADEYGYRPKFKLVNLGLESPDTPKEDTEKTFGLKSFEFVWYPLN